MLAKEAKVCATLLVQTNFNFWKYLTRVSAASNTHVRRWYVMPSLMGSNRDWTVSNTWDSPPPSHIFALHYMLPMPSFPHHNNTIIASFFQPCNWWTNTHSTQITMLKNLHFWKGMTSRPCQKNSKNVPALVLFNLDWLKRKLSNFLIFYTCFQKLWVPISEVDETLNKLFNQVEREFSSFLFPFLESQTDKIFTDRRIDILWIQNHLVQAHHPP